MQSFLKKISITMVLVFYTLIANALSNPVPWPDWVKQLRIDAINNGITATTFDQVFQNIHGPDPRVIRLYSSQPEGRLTFLQYRQTRADNIRIKMGQQEYIKHKALLDDIGRKYGVDPYIILSLWGLETDYGHFMGSFFVPSSLATLAYISDRPQFFRSELMRALHIFQEGHVSLADFKGEWAGASGHPQFLPSSWYKYAVDYDGDGRKNIWKSLPDAFASIANYLAKNGWQAGQEWAVEVSLPQNFDTQLLGKHTVKTVQEWRSLGVQFNFDNGFSNQTMASIIQFNNGPAFMVFNNFKTLQTWNESNYYVTTVGYLADQIRKS
ncbi:MAG: lytic murein transglycosylase [Proteobacteria bacterium]|nr:lytic murein transglycosylase [Pseudomonadota bacterium]